MKKLLAMLFPVFLAVSCSESSFPDPAFEKCVKVNKFDEKDDYRKLTLLVCDSMGIESMSGIEEMPLLERVKLRGNLIRDIGPLAELKKLNHLELQDNMIDDLEPLTSLFMLEYLDIGENCFSSWSYVEEMVAEIKSNNPTLSVREGFLKGFEECQ